MPAPVLCITEDTANDLEAVALKYYERLYNQEPYPNLTVDEMLAILEIFRNSPTEREKVILKFLYTSSYLKNSEPADAVNVSLSGMLLDNDFISCPESELTE